MIDQGDDQDTYEDAFDTRRSLFDGGFIGIVALEKHYAKCFELLRHRLGCVANESVHLCTCHEEFASSCSALSACGTSD